MCPERRVLTREKTEIHNWLMEICQLTDEAIDKSWRCFRDHDSVLAQRVIEEDEKINSLQHKAEAESIITIAGQQPMASDLRILISDMFIAAELERIADHASGIARMVLLPGDEPQQIFIESIEELVSKCRKMLVEVMSAYENIDAEQAKQVAEMDNVIDSEEERIMKAILSHMCENPEDINTYTHILWLVHSLERIGDRVTNIAERVVFMATGETVEFN